MELELKSVSKSYQKGQKIAVDDFSMKFEAGVYGLLGPNGAGKSTLMNMITDNLKPDKGTICYNGTSILTLGAEYRNLLGYMPQQQNLYDDFSGEEFLWYMASLKGMKKCDAAEQIEMLLKIVNLSDERYKKLKAYSGGMRQRILIAQALLNNPSILILDEPTAGLDPKERIRIRNFISEMAKNKIVLLATHVVSDIEYIAREILIMQNGHIVKGGTPEKLLQSMEHKVFEILVNEEEKRWYENQNYRIANVMYAGEGTCLRIVSDEKPTKGTVQESRPSLEDVYLYLV